MLALKVRRERTNDVLKRLFQTEIVDRRRKIVENGAHVLIPLSSRPFEELEGAELVEVNDSSPRKSSKPMVRIREMLDIPEHLKSLLPCKWELVGDVLIFKLHSSLRPYMVKIAEVYASVLKAKAVFGDIGGIKDEFRVPELERILGKESETMHRENGILYKLDASKLMFSSGNKHERMRMARIIMEGELVLDMFAGIGYFALPIAKYCTPRKVIACEKNPLAFHYLCENIRLNRLDSVRPFLIDCRDLELDEKVDRIIMGYVKDTQLYLPKALDLIRTGGRLHYHEVCAVELLPERPLERLRNEASRFSRDLRIENYRVVKSYAPKVAHVVLDVQVL